MDSLGEKRTAKEVLLIIKKWSQWNRIAQNKSELEREVKILYMVGKSKHNKNTNNPMDHID